MHRLSASDRSALIRLAASLPKGSDERRAILAGLVSDPLGLSGDKYEFKMYGYTFAVQLPSELLDDDYPDTVSFTVHEGGGYPKVEMSMGKADFAKFAGEMARALKFGKDA